jgi:tetratricopeptide (TPR) repeat protein
MSDGQSNAVFISYRREVGGILAMALHQQLVASGLDAFYDIESIRAGQFDTIILRQIAARPYFLLVLTPGTLECCNDPRDWLRREMEQALTTQRMVVPVHTPNFDFGDFERFLPSSVGQEVRRFNAQELPQRWFKFAVQQLVDEFLVPTKLETAPVPAGEQKVVERMQEAAQAKPAVTDVHLSAHEYFERAYARAETDTEGMIADYSEALRLNPEYAEAFANRGFARYRSGDAEGAIADLDEALRLDPLLPEAFNNRGNARYDRGEEEGAIADYSQELRLNPQHVNAFFNRGIARYDTGDLEGAIADYSEALRLNPQHAEAFNNRGRVRHAKGDTDGAITDYNEALRLNPELAVTFYNRGNARYAKGDLEGAIADYSQELRLNPQHAETFYNRGNARYARGDRVGAIADIERAARLAPGNEAFPRRLDELRERT